MSYARSVMALSACFCLAPDMAAASAEPPAPPASREVKILAHGAWPYVPVYAAVAAPRKLQQWVFRDDKELDAAAGPHGAAVVARALKTDAIDFKKDMLLAVADGTQPLVGISGGGAPSAPNRIEVDRISVDEKGKTMTVRWRTAPRDPKGAIITVPLEVVLVPRFDGDVRFERQAASAKDEELAAGTEVKILGRAFWPDGWRAEEPARQWIVRRYADLIDPRLEANETILERMRKENADRYAKALKVDSIDFGKQMLVGISGGVQPSGGYRVEATRAVIDAEGKRMTVYWKLHSPDRDEKVAPAPTHPAEVLLVEQFAGEVRFEEEPMPKP